MAGPGGALPGPLSPRRSSGDPHATRPSLRRLTSRNTDLVLAALQPGRQSSSRYNDGVRRSLDELGPWTKAADGPREALLHDVAKNDSLAGIALQYGITVQALRQANRLWASDSIHLRKTLYVPLDACTLPPAKEVIERIDVDGDDVRIYSRALPKRPTTRSLAPTLPSPSLARLNGAPPRTSLDLERLVPSSRTSIDSAASQYLPETNAAYPASPELPDGRLIDVEREGGDDDRELGDLIERTLKLGFVPAPPSATQPFFRISPSPSTDDLPSSPTPTLKAPRKPKTGAGAPVEAVAMGASSSRWGLVDNDEIRQAAAYIERSQKGSSGPRPRRTGWL